MIPIAYPLLGAEEQEAVARVLASAGLAQGEQVPEFERRFARFCQVREAIAVSSGTAALHLALLAHGIGPGDEVITTPFSFAATANVVRLVGATPVFVDIEPDTYNIDTSLVEEAITPRTKALLPVHLYGNPCDMQRLGGLAAAYGLAVIEDACQAHGATIAGKRVGSFGTGCFSLYATKNMTTGEGGMVTTDDPAIAERVRLWRSHGQAERYYHVALGFNLRLTEMQAAIGLVQLEKLPMFTERRASNAAFLTERLRGWVQTPIAREGHQHVYQSYTIRAPQDRDAWVTALRERGVGTGVHYPRTIPQQPAYSEHDFTAHTPMAEAAAEQVLSLPVHPALSQEDLDTIAREVIALCRG